MVFLLLRQILMMVYQVLGSHLCVLVRMELLKEVEPMNFETVSMVYQELEHVVTRRHSGHMEEHHASVEAFLVHRSELMGHAMKVVVMMLMDGMIVEREKYCLGILMSLLTLWRQ